LDGGARGAATADIGRLAPIRGELVLLILEISNFPTPSPFKDALVDGNFKIVD
jgi:hypothetical protein